MSAVYCIADILAGIIFGGFARKKKKIAIGGYRCYGTTFSGSLPGWRGFNIGGVIKKNPPIRQI